MRGGEGSGRTGLDGVGGAGNGSGGSHEVVSLSLGEALEPVPVETGDLRIKGLDSINKGTGGRLVLLLGGTNVLREGKLRGEPETKDEMRAKAARVGWRGGGRGEAARVGWRAKKGGGSEEQE